MRSTVLLGRLSLLVLLTSGCANMLNKGKQSLVINSEPQGASVFENGAEVGVTPYSYTYDRTDGSSVMLDLRKDGLEGRSVELRPRSANGPLLADALLLNIPYYLSDAHSTALYVFPRKELVIPMYKTLPADAERTELPVVAAVSELGSRTSFGKIGSKTINSSSRVVSDLSYMDIFTSSLISGMRPSYLDARVVRTGTQKGDEALRRAKVFLKPVLKDLSIHLDEVDHSTYGQVEMDMRWEFRSGLDKDSVLFTVERHTTYPVFNESASSVLSSAAKDAGRRLLEEDGMADRLAMVFSSGLKRSKGEAVELKQPTPIAFTGRKDMLSALVKAVVTIETSDGHGSGFVITNDGYILTNAHVVDEEQTVKVRFQQGFTLDGTVVKLNRDFDVALVKTSASDLPALSIGDDAGLQLGEELYAIGTPLDEKLGQTVTRGIMSGRREFEGRSFIQTDVSINPGNSGGPLIDENGKVVGVATLKIQEVGVQGIGFGVPISKAVEMLNLSFRP